MRKKVYYFVLLLIVVVFVSSCSARQNILKSPNVEYSSSKFDSSYQTTIDPESKIVLSAVKEGYPKENIVSENPLWDAPIVRTPIPRIDGIIEDSEIKDAKLYTLSDQYTTSNIYIKNILVPSFDSSALSNQYLYLAYMFERGIINPEANWDFLLFFDEGDDGFYGSGSYDNYLTVQQEDWKAFSRENSFYLCHNFFNYTEGCPEIQCMPWQNDNCWSCVPGSGGEQGQYFNENYWTGSTCVQSPTGEMRQSVFGKRSWVLDGYKFSDSAWAAWSEANGINTVNYLEWGAERDNKVFGEILVPIKGFDGPSFDKSDLNITSNDTVGFYFEFRIAGGVFNFPSEADGFTPTSWARMQFTNMVNDPD